MDLLDLKEKLDLELNKGLINPKILLDRLRVIEESSRKTAAYQDPRYIPFYYYLGKHIEPKNLVEIGTGLGFLTSSFLRSCKSVQKLLEFERKTESFYSSRLAIGNIKDSYKGDFDFYYGNPTDDEFIKKLDSSKWELAFINQMESLDVHRVYFDLLWERMPLDGLIVIDYLSRHQPANDAFIGFCKIVNRKPTMVNTRYGTGIVQK